MCEKPKTIFRYEGFNTQSLLNLKSQIIYFASPQKFNDPYDCAINAPVADPTPEEKSKIVEAIRNGRAFPKEPRLSKDLPAWSNGMSQDKVIENLRGGVNDLIEIFRDELKDSGVCCFSEQNDNLLMWSHYSDGGRGFCLEFCTECGLFSDSDFYKVIYVYNMPKIDMYPVVVSDYEQMRELLYTKSKDWTYEQEWRVIWYKETDFPMKYESQALKAVYFGSKMEPQAQEIVSLILKEQNPDIEFWKGHPSESEFKMEFERVTYTSYAEAKKKGEI